MSGRLRGSLSAIYFCYFWVWQGVTPRLQWRPLFLDQEDLALLLNGQASEPSLLLTEDPYSFSLLTRYGVSPSRWLPWWAWIEGQAPQMHRIVFQAMRWTVISAHLGITQEEAWSSVAKPWWFSSSLLLHSKVCSLKLMETQCSHFTEELASCLTISDKRKSKKICSSFNLIFG